MTQLLENVTFNELALNQTASLTRKLEQKDIELFASVSGDINPAHLDEDYAKDDIFHGIVGHGMWLGSLISTVLGTILPGPGTIYLEQCIKFKKPVRIGDDVTVTVRVSDKEENRSIVTFDCACVNQNGDVVADGQAVVLAPVDKISIEAPELPVIETRAVLHSFDELLKGTLSITPLKTAIVHPVNAHSIISALEAQEKRFIDPVFVGPRHRIEAAAREARVDISGIPIIDTEHSHAAAQKAVAMASAFEVEALMKGALHTEELLSAILAPASRLRTERRLSHAYLMDIPNFKKPVIITDAAVNIAPNLEEKADICRNAINLWRSVYGDKKPKVAILAAIETINPKMQATLDAAALCKMAERGQIANAIMDGPLAMDLAISPASVEEKHIISSVAGDADILVMPDIESGNILAKQLTFLGRAEAAGIVLGARVPIIMTSRSDSPRSRLLSCALAAKLHVARKEGRIK